MNFPELFIFDMDGLMFDTERLFFENIRQTAAEYGYNFTIDIYLQTVGTSGEILRNILNTNFGESYPSIEISRLAQNKMFDYMSDNVLPIKPGLITLLTYLKSKNSVCIVASSTKTAYVNRYLENTSLSNYFTSIVGGDMVAKTKPEPDIFIKACNMCNIEAKSALVLEDSLNGIKASIAAGIPVICIPDMILPNEYIKSHALKIYKKLDEVIGFLESL